VIVEREIKIPMSLAGRSLGNENGLKLQRLTDRNTEDTRLTMATVDDNIYTVYQCIA
jgi:hypothetical protein